MIPVDGESRARSALSAGSRVRLLACQPDEIVDSISLRLGFEGCKLCDLAVVGCDDKLAAAPMRHAVVAAEGVQHRLALDAEPRLEETGRVVDASVDDLAVARTRPRADRVFSLDDDHLAPCARKRPRDRQAHNPGADHETVDRLHENLLRVMMSDGKRCDVTHRGHDA
jgi:hypothetical protein